MSPGRSGNDTTVRMFAVVGTDVHPFSRMVSWVDRWVQRQQDQVDCFVQYGYSAPPEHAQSAAFVDHDELEKRLVDADVFLCHGGPSTISEARRRGLRPVVVPRLRALGEHVDDHQRLFVRRLARDDLVLTADTRDGFERLLDDVLVERSLVHHDPGDGSGPESAVRRFGELVAGLFRP